MTDTHSAIAALLADNAKALADADGAPVSPVYIFAAANELTLLIGRTRDQLMQPAPAPAEPSPVAVEPIAELATEEPAAGPVSEPAPVAVDAPLDQAATAAEEPAK